MSAQELQAAAAKEAERLIGNYPIFVEARYARRLQDILELAFMEGANWSSERTVQRMELASAPTGAKQ